MDEPTLNSLKYWVELSKNAAEIIAFVFGSGWAWFKIREFRQFKNWIELEIDSNLHKLDLPVQAKIPTWDKKGNVITKDQLCTHAVEILLKFTNKGSTRLRMFNIQLGINTMRPPDDTQFDKGDGHLHLTRIFTSGNLVPEMPVKGKPIDLSSFYYIEPTVSQTIEFCTVIPQPRELLQVYVEFSLTQKRIFPKSRRLPGGLYPHTAARTYKVDANPQIVKVKENHQAEK